MTDDEQCMLLRTGLALCPSIDDLERISGLRGGSIFHGEQELARLAFIRPTPDLARYATPVRGPVPLRRGHARPGGGVLAASGHNAAMRVVAHRRRAALRRRAGALERGTAQTSPRRVVPGTALRREGERMSVARTETKSTKPAYIAYFVDSVSRPGAPRTPRARRRTKRTRL